MILSTYLRNQLTPKALERIHALGWIDSHFITEHKFVPEAWVPKLKGISKKDRFRIVPIDWGRLEEEIARVEVEFCPRVEDPAVCWNYEDPHAWLSWAAQGDDKLRRWAMEGIGKFWGTVLGRSKITLPGPWGTALVNRKTLEPHPWRNAAALLGRSVHVSGYYKTPENEAASLDWVTAQLENAIELASGPVRLWVWSQCHSGDLMPLDYLRRLGSLVAAYDDADSPYRVGITLFGITRWTDPDLSRHQVDAEYMNAAAAITEGAAQVASIYRPRTENG